MANISSYLPIIVSLLLLLFPVLANQVTHASSTVLAILMLMGLPVVLSNSKRPLLSTPEKWVMWMFGAYSLVYLFSFALHGLLGHLLDPRLKYLGDALRMLCMLPVFALFRYLKISEGFLWSGINAAALMAGIYAIYSFFRIAPGARVDGSYDAIAFGDISLTLAVMSIASLNWLKKKHKGSQFIPLSAFVLGMTACILTGSRGAWVAIPGLFVILFFYMGRYVNLVSRLMLVGICCLLAIAAYKVPATKVAPRIKSAFTEVTDYFQGEIRYGGATVRLQGWRAGAHIFRAHPIIGAGPGNFKPMIDQLVAQGKLPENMAWHSQPASTFLASMVDCGLIGLLALLGMFISPLWISIRLIQRGDENRNFGYALMMLVVAFFHFGLSETIFRRSVYTNFYIIMVGAIMAVASNHLSAAEKSG